MSAETMPRAAPSSRAFLGTAIGSGIMLACGIVTGLIAARSLGPTGRGELAAITVWASTRLYAGTFGLPEAVVYFTAAEPSLGARVWATAQPAMLRACAAARGLLHRAPDRTSDAERRAAPMW